MKETMKRLFLLSSIVFFVAAFSACAKPKVELSVSKSQIKQGESVSVNWKSQNSKEVLLNNQAVAKTGTQVFQPDQSTTYQLVGRSGKKEAKDAKTVSVEVLPAGPQITLTADNPAINKGDKTLLRWQSQRAEKVEIPGLGTFGPSGQAEVTPFQSTTYTATARGAGGEASASARVTVTEKTDSATNNPRDGFIEDDNKWVKENVKPVFFEFDKADLSQTAKGTLDGNARALQQSGKTNIVVRIEGNCDPRGSEEYNLALGDRRANETKTYLVSKGIDPSRMDVISNGKRFAAGSSEGTPEQRPSWAYDRRAEFIYVRTNLRPAPAE
jgi:peptidoglycan-associated lipoprotein